MQDRHNIYGSSAEFIAIRSNHLVTPIAVLDFIDPNGFYFVQLAVRQTVSEQRYQKDVLERLPHMTNQQTYLLIPRAWAEKKRQAMKRAP